MLCNYPRRTVHGDQRVNRKLTKWVVCVALGLAGVGCMSIGEIDRTANKSGEKATFVLGVAPTGTWVAVFPGEIKETGINFSDISRAVFYGPSRDGYIVGHTGSARPLGIMQVRLVSNAGGFAGRNFIACGQGRTLVFTPKKGVSSYLGDVSYSYAKSTGLAAAYSENIERAQRFVSANYPGLGQLQLADRKVLPALDGCMEWMGGERFPME